MNKGAAGGRIERLPVWIWQPGLKRCREWTAVKRFELPDSAANVSLYLAGTGRVEVELDGRTWALQPEHPEAVTRFERIIPFPQTIDAGPHILRFRICSTSEMPITPVNIHLIDRSVGFIAFLQGDGLWLPTDESWETEDGQAAVVCLLGEEPFGDLLNGHDWFIAGGYGDIRVSPVDSVQVLHDVGVSCVWEGAPRSQLKIWGTAAGEWPYEDVAVPKYFKFYHVRKQWEWRERRGLQRNVNVPGIPYVTVDLLQECNVRLRVENRGDEPVTMLWNGAESLYELDAYDGCITEQFTSLPGQEYVTLPQGLRYVRLYFFAVAGSSFELSVRFEQASFPLTQVGTLRCDVPLFERIYDVSVHTNRVCHQLGLWDGIKRDRLSWVYDYYLAAKSAYVLWDDLTVLKRSIREIGIGTPTGYWMNDIPAYTMWWFHQVWEYYWHTGDQAFVLELKDAVQRHAAWLTAHIDADTGRFKAGSFSFFDWSPMERSEYAVALNGLFKLTVDVLSRLAVAIPGLGLNVSLDVPQLAESAFLAAGASLITPLIGILCGAVSESRAKAFLLAYEPADPITPMSAYWFAECCSQFGLHDKAWQVISTVWGAMVEQKATTFWESSVLQGPSDFHDNQTTYRSYGSYRISLCHSWSSTPVYWMSRYVLGVEPASPGYATVRFRPALPSGMGHCNGTVSTPHGPVCVELSRQPDGSVASRIELPPAIKLISTS